ncbi:MAG: glycosyltransferase involved in cell wall biosynthesis, partial [Planctomycetota bacterium]
MKILVVPSWYPPNGGRFFRLQSESLAKLGHKVDVLILEEKGLTQKRNLKIENVKSDLINEFRHTFYRIPKMNNLNIELFIRKYKRLLQEYLNVNKPDVIYVQSCSWAGIVVSEIAVKLKIPYVVSEQKSIFFYDEFPFSAKIEEKISLAFSQANSVVANSKMMKKALSKYASNIVVIPNLVDVNFFRPEVKNNIDNFTFISVGNLLPVKGYDILLKAFAEVLKHKKNISLTIIGKGKGLNSLLQLARDLEIEGFVYFKGYKTSAELVKEYNDSSAYISSSRMETFGMTIIEAMSCGLPVVATKAGGPDDIVNENNGYLAEVEDVNSLKSKMILMIENISKFDSKKIRQNVIANYSENMVIKKFETQL